MKRYHERAFCKSDFLACTIVFFLCLGVRLATSWYIEDGGDAIYKWMEARRIIAGLGFQSWNQHTMRWSLMLPTIAVQYLLEQRAWSCYVFPIFMTCLGSAVAYCLGFVVHSRPAGWLCGLAVVFYPGMIRSGAQFLPCGPETVWVLASLLMLFVYAANHKTKHLIVSAVVLFIGYGAKITALYFLPGILLWLVFFQRDWRPAGVYLAVLAALFAMETLVLYKLAGDPLGRIGVLAGSKHIEYSKQGVFGDPWTCWQWLFGWRDYLAFSLYAKYSIFIGLAAAVCVFILRKKQLYLLSAAYLSGFILHTWTVVSIMPIVPPQPHMVRYLLVLQILGALLTILLLVSTPARIATPGVGKIRHFKTVSMYIRILNHALAAYVVLFFFMNTKSEWLSQDACNSIWAVVNDEKCLRDSLSKGDAFAIIGNQEELLPCLTRMEILFMELDDIASLTNSSPSEVYKTQEGDLFVFRGDLSKDTPVAMGGMGFRRQHPFALKLLEKKSEPIERIAGITPPCGSRGIPAQR